ncbi:unnamed protein product [Cyclocybe aegerita]|uniref:Uncharacterized protein n=1 Tax=Cyclocybe aegerita TaxID=1973307 RepID=A0A8S0VZ24_CYCAE|nr:unnamed protein product [Cyclocybe aegerita]
MSSQSSHYTPARPTSSRHHVKNLLHVLRRANAHYSQLAASIRASLTPTHHARKRARALRLQVSTQAARKLEYTQVSVLPLPVLELGEEGVEEVAMREVRAKESRIVAPIPRRATEMALKQLEEERAIRRAQRPVLRCAIPSVQVQPAAHGQDAASGVSVASSVSVYSTVTVELTPASALNASYAVEERSRWSCTTIDPQDSQEVVMAMVMDDEEEMDQMEIPEVSIEHSPVDYSPSMMDDVPVTAETSIDMQTQVGGAPSPAARPRMPRARQHTYAHTHTHAIPALPPTLDVPVDVARLSWGSDIFSSSASAALSSASATDSSGLLTPEDNEKLMIRIKRKSGAFEQEAEEEMQVAVEEKRPKYGRKEWVTPARRVYPRRF